MRIIPVLDLQRGHIVRGVGGRRTEYQPLRGTLTASSLPVEVARAIQQQFGLTEFYLADLDALAGARPALETYAALRREGVALWVDAGLRDARDAAPLATAGVEVFVAGLETLRGPHVLAELVRAYGSERILFSLDLKDGLPLGDTATWRTSDPWHLATQAVEAGIRRLLILDLARVGTGQGTGTEELGTRLTAAYPHVACAVGGGIRGVEDLHRLARSSVQAVLVASALHDGRLCRADLDRL